VPKGPELLEHKKRLQNFRGQKNLPTKFQIFQKRADILANLAEIRHTVEVGNTDVDLTIGCKKNPTNANCSAENPPPERNHELKRIRTFLKGTNVIIRVGPIFS
jgi:hypothetical protein